MTAPPVLSSIDARGVATVTFNRPEVNNAYNAELIQGVLEGLDHFLVTAAVRVVVLKGKFLDCDKTLSVQVHPNDQQAAKLDPPDAGKTEAWVVLAAEPGSYRLATWCLPQTTRYSR